jgi:hypothetical protein
VDAVNSADASLWGPAVPPEAAKILNAGLEELPGETLTRLADDLWRAQTLLIGAAWRAAFESGRVVEVCPDTPEELFNPERVMLRVKKGCSGRVGGEVHRGSSMVMPVQQR